VHRLELGDRLQSLAQQREFSLRCSQSVALEETVAACAKQEGKVIAVPTDVTQPEPCQQLIEQAIAAFGQIVSGQQCRNFNADSLGEITDLSIFEQVMQVNYLGAVYCTHYALPYLKANRGLLVAISSLCGKTAVPTRTGYVASTPCKASLILRIELGSGVMLVVSPGFVATDIRQRALEPTGNRWGKVPVMRAKAI